MAAKADVNAICSSEPLRTEGSKGTSALAKPTDDVAIFTPLMLAIRSDVCLVGLGHGIQHQSVISGPQPEAGVRHVHIAKVLIAAKANLNIVGTRQHTALHFVASMPNKIEKAGNGTILPNEESIELLNVLIASRANLHAKNCDERTALHIATSTSAVETLLSAKVCLKETSF